MEYWDTIWELYHVILRFISVIAVLMVIVIIHELGHYLVGRWCGIKAIVFSIGFGPELFARTDKKGTRWRIAALPLGGYVRFLGDEAISSGDITSQQKQKLPKGAFAAANAWKRLATVFAGPFFNAVLAVIILSFMAFHFGKFTISPVVSSVVPNSPAAQSGLKPGDRFIMMNGEAIKSFDEISRYIMVHENEPIFFTVEREGKNIPLTIIPRTQRVDDGFGNIIRIGRIGIVGVNDPKNIQKQGYTAPQAFKEGISETGFVIQQTGRYLGKLVQGRGDRCQLSGPVRTAQIAWKVSDVGVWALVQLAAFLSIGIGLFNLLPIPPLDGGHLFFYLIEAVSGYSVPLNIQEIVFKAGWIIILLFTVLAILNNYIPC